MSTPPVRIRSIERIAAAIAVCCAAASTAAASAADEPRVVRVRVPADRVRDWFPPGTELRSLAVDEFDRLLEEARRGRLRAGEPAPIELARVDHSVVWSGGVLTGRTRISPAREAGGSGWLPLGRWSPAIAPPVSGTVASPPAIRADAEGRPGLHVNASSPERFEIDWRHDARPNSGGRLFLLELPESTVGRFDLELPETLIPELTTGIALGSSVGRSATTRVWNFAGVSGSTRLRLRPASAPAEASRPWVSGSTRIDVGASGGSWVGSWRVDFPPDASARLEIAFDPGVELLGIEGSDVRSFEASEHPTGSRAIVAFSGSNGATREFRIRAAVKVPNAGSWSIPAARPVDAAWLGGRVTVTFDASRVVTRCRPSAGPPIDPDPESVAGRAGVLAFEPSEPVSPAVLDLRPAGRPSIASVAGLLRLDGETPRLSARLTWQLGAGVTPRFVAELTPGWSVARVEGDDDPTPIPWRSEPIAGGRSRITFFPTAGDSQTESTTIVVHAAAPPSDLATPFGLPRIRPTADVVEDERWVALTRKSALLRPTIAKSLAWIDPESLFALSGDFLLARTSRQSAIAWRWLSDDAEARARIEPLPTDREARIRQRVVIRGERLDFEWEIDFPVEPSSTSALAMLPSEPFDVAWTRGDGTTPAAEVEPLAAEERARQGLAPRGSAWRFRFARGVERAVFRGRGRLQRPADGSIPLLSLDGRARWAATVEVALAPEILADTETTGLRALPIESFLRPTSSAVGGSVDEQADARLFRVFAYDDASARLVARVNRDESRSARGVIREAVLTSIIDPEGERRHRLLLMTAVRGDSALELQFPEGIRVERIARDGQEVAATRAGTSGRIAIPLGGSGGSRSIAIDYTAGPGPGRAQDSLSPDLPTCSLPCASFCWEATLPPAWNASRPRIGSKLTAVDAARGRATVGPGRPAVLVDRAESSRKADAAATLSEWLLDLEGDPRPLLVDRLGLLEAGWGPRSQIRAGGVAETLDGLGLVLRTYSTVLVVTTARAIGAEADGDRGELAGRFAEAIASGADRDDRFQSVERWRGEPTPRGWRSTALETWPRPDRDLSGWKTYRFLGTSWPAPEASVALTRRDTVRGIAWAMGCLSLAATIILLSRRGDLGSIGHASLAGAALAASASSDATWSSIGNASCLGILLGTSFSIRRLWSRGGGFVEDAPRSWWVRPVRRTTITAGCLAAMVGSTSGMPIQDTRLERILVLLPYEGVPRAEAEPDRVLIRLADDRELRRWAASGADRLGPRITILDSSHVAVREAVDRVAVESVYRIEVEGEGRVPWRFPIGRSIDIVADIDGRETPIAVALDQPEASLEPSRPGIHEIRIIRRVPLEMRFDRMSMRLPIRSCPTSTLEVRDGPSVRPARGVVGTRLLGPTSELAIDWPLEGSERPAPAKTRVSGLVLWDATPAGDLARLRLTSDDPRGTSELRIAIDGGTQVRPSRIPGLIEARAEGGGDRVVWTARIEPAVPPGVPIELELWRPTAVGRGVAAVGEPLRSLPSFEVIGAGEFEGIVALRHPGGWTGRLGSTRAADEFGEEAFATAWGPFPADDLTLSGAVRFASRGLVALRTGPPPARLRARSRLDLELEQGRVEVRLTSVLSSEGDSIREAELEIPPGFVALDVAAPGLTAVEPPASGERTLRLRFDGLSARERMVMIKGKFDLPGPVSLDSARRFEFETPGFRWSGAQAEPGTLAVASSVRPEVSLGGAALNVERPAPGEPHRLEQPMPAAAGAIRLRWAAVPAEVRVQVDGRLTLLRDRVEWRALLRYEIEGPALDVLFVKIPAEWADGLEVESWGTALSMKKESRAGSVIVQLTPSSPIWGTAKFELRSRRALAAMTTLDFPDAAPLGQGAVEKRLEVLRTGLKRLPLEASEGLTPIEPEPGDDAERLGFAGRPAFRVESEPWTLRLRLDPGDEANETETSARVLQSAISITRGGDGAGWGLGRFDVEPTPGRLLELTFDDPTEIAWAVVDGVVVRPLRSGDRKVILPIERPTLGRVVALWPLHPADGPRGSSSAARIAIPSVSRGESATMISIFAPEDVEIGATSVGLRPVDEPTWWVEVVERRARTLATLTTNRIPLEPAVRDAASEAIREWVLLERQARRAVERAPASAREESSARLDQAWGTLFDTLQLQGLDDLIDRAFRRAPETLDRSAAAMRTGQFDPVEPIRLRQLGLPRRFLGTIGSANGNEAAPASTDLVATPRAVVARPGDSDAFPGLAAVGVWFGLVLLVQCVRRGILQTRPRPVLVGLVCIAAVGMLVEPGLTAATLGIGLLGGVRR
ncbi:MAG: hypothetical protein SFX72_07450 [Isosphaeraceae bacterium]|nr:hypothetical protein [Isosphaeraceae bacterium]